MHCSPLIILQIVFSYFFAYLTIQCCKYAQFGSGLDGRPTSNRIVHHNSEDILNFLFVLIDKSYSLTELEDDFDASPIQSSGVAETLNNNNNNNQILNQFPLSLSPSVLF